jgi:hypothetical protein
MFKDLGKIRTDSEGRLYCIALKGGGVMEVLGTEAFKDAADRNPRLKAQKSRYRPQKGAPDDGSARPRRLIEVLKEHALAISTISALLVLAWIIGGM